MRYLISTWFYIKLDIYISKACGKNHQNKISGHKIEWSFKYLVVEC